jgi:hypothetical protein
MVAKAFCEADASLILYRGSGAWHVGKVSDTDDAIVQRQGLDDAPLP